MFRLLLKITPLSGVVAVEKDESVSRSYLSELQNITLHLKEAEQRLMRAIETPPPSRLSGEGADITVHIAAQEVSLIPTCWSKQRATLLYVAIFPVL